MTTSMDREVTLTRMPSRDEQLEIVAEVARAPSVHNVQPARWRFIPGAVLLLEDVRRRLPAADPSAHDTQASLGAAWEGMSIALSARRMHLSAPERISGVDEQAPWLRVVARGAISSSLNAHPDVLAPYVEKRRAWRGEFVPLDESELSRLVALGFESGDIALMSDEASIQTVGG